MQVPVKRIQIRTATLEELDLYLQKVPVNRPVDGRILIESAIRHGRVDLVRRMCDAHRADIFRNQAIRVACEEGRLQCLKYFLEEAPQHAELNFSDFLRGFALAVQHQHLKIVRYLAEACFAVPTQDRSIQQIAERCFEKNRDRLFPLRTLLMHLNVPKEYWRYYGTSEHLIRYISTLRKRLSQGASISKRQSAEKSLQGIVTRELLDFLAVLSQLPKTGISIEVSEQSLELLREKEKEKPSSDLRLRQLLPTETSDSGYAVFRISSTPHAPAKADGDAGVSPSRLSPIFKRLDGLIGERLFGLTSSNKYCIFNCLSLQAQCLKKEVYLSELHTAKVLYVEEDLVKLRAVNQLQAQS